jgi:phosphocarrier protein HPr
MKSERRKENKMVEQTIEITNPTGLHARPAALFVQTAAKFSSHVWLAKTDKKVNAKSIMGLMSLAIPRGTFITLTVEGEDEELALEELTSLIENNFYEET